MNETYVVQVKNNEQIINSTNDLYSHFGWNVLNIQITESQNSSFKQTLSDVVFGMATNVTTTINYATITYQRDKKMLNYDKIKDFENQYKTIDNLIQQTLESNEYHGPLKKGILPILWKYSQKDQRLENEKKINEYKEQQLQILNKCETFL